jgi:RNA polymerase sigma-54 factor
MFQTHQQSLRPLTTAHLAQTMTLLSLTADELREQIESELASNPALELLEERRCPTCHRLLPPRGACPTCSSPKSEEIEEPIVFVSPREDFNFSGGMTGEDMPEDNYSSTVEDLPTFVLRQIASELDNSERTIAAYFLTHLDDDGLLTIPLIEIARYFHVPLSKVEEIQKKIQRAEPYGVGSCSPQEALLAQLDLLEESREIPPLARSIIEKEMSLLSRHQYAELARAFKVSLRTIHQTVAFITENLNPFPARSHWGDMRQSTEMPPQVYHRPDILMSFLNDDPSKPLVIEIIMPLNGTLRVNPMFRSAIHEADQDKKDDWKNDLERASLFVKCLQQRNHTITRLMHRVAALQRNFICRGEKYLKPVTRAQLSTELGVHESTISRAVANKAVQLPNGRIIPLAMFFDRSLNVRQVLKEIIEKEAHSLSDTEISELLSEQGYQVARRTVAKYRAMEGILPAHLRRPAPGVG